MGPQKDVSVTYRYTFPACLKRTLSNLATHYPVVAYRFSALMKVLLLSALMLALPCSFAADVQLDLVQSNREFVGKISEWAVPTPKYVRDPVMAANGHIYFAVRDGDKIGRFNTSSKSFQEWDLPPGMRPLSPVVTRTGKVFFGGTGNNAIGELDPVSGEVKTHTIPSKDAYPYSLVLDKSDNVWFTERKLGAIGKFDRITGAFTEYPIGFAPYALAIDGNGNLWASLMDTDTLAKIDPSTGQMSKLHMGLGSMPRRMAVAPDGKLWVALYGVGKLAMVDPVKIQILKTFDLPGGANSGPYAVNVDHKGKVWVSEIQTDQLVVVNPANSAMRVFKLPSRDSGVRNAVIAPNGRYWFIASHMGKIGVVD